ncbi:MAG: FkbM family methyltransferase [Gammaproteobacteria bacterium]
MDIPTRIANISGHTIIEGPLSYQSIVLDLGANCGEFSLAINNRLGCTVHAVEPTPLLAKFLRKNDIINVHEMAVTAQGKDVFFHVDSYNNESSSVVSEKDDCAVLVKGVTLGELIMRIGRVDLIKMDIEGSEIGVLMSVSEDIIKHIPQITVEFHDFKNNSGVTTEMVRHVCKRLSGMDFEPIVMSFWTNGDVLFVNKKFFQFNFIIKLVLQLKGCWIPGIFRTLNRVRNSIAL